MSIEVKWLNKYCNGFLGMRPQSNALLYASTVIFTHLII